MYKKGENEGREEKSAALACLLALNLISRGEEGGLHCHRVKLMSMAKGVDDYASTRLVWERENILYEAHSLRKLR